MIKRMTLLQRRHDFSPADFDAHWAGPHGAIARRLPRLIRYNQNSVRRRSDPDAHRIDGIVELWFSDADAMAASLATPIAAELPADEPNFLSGITILAIRPDVLKAGEGAAKVMVVADLAEPLYFLAKAWFNALPAQPDIAGIAVNHIDNVSARSNLGALAYPPSVVIEFVGADSERLWRAVERVVASLNSLRTSIYAVEERRIV